MRAVGHGRRSLRTTPRGALTGSAAEQQMAITRTHTDTARAVKCQAAMPAGRRIWGGPPPARPRRVHHKPTCRTNLDGRQRQHVRGRAHGRDGVDDGEPRRGRVQEARATEDKVGERALLRARARGQPGRLEGGVGAVVAGLRAGRRGGRGRRRRARCTDEERRYSVRRACVRAPGEGAPRARVTAASGGARSRRASSVVNAPPTRASAASARAGSARSARCSILLSR